MAQGFDLGFQDCVKFLCSVIQARLFAYTHVLLDFLGNQRGAKEYPRSFLQPIDGSVDRSAHASALICIIEFPTILAVALHRFCICINTHCYLNVAVCVESLAAVGLG